jgi:hypothetical protein
MASCATLTHGFHGRHSQTFSRRISLGKACFGHYAILRKITAILRTQACSGKPWVFPGFGFGRYPSSENGAGHRSRLAGTRIAATMRLAVRQGSEASDGAEIS